MEYEGDSDTNCNCVHGKVHQILENRQREQEIRKRIKRVQTLIKSTRVLRRVLETLEDLISLRLQLNTLSEDWRDKVERNCT